RRWTVRGTRADDNQVLLHRDWTKGEREAWGEIEDAGYRFVRGMSEVSHDLSLATMYKRIADNPNWVRDQDPGGWVHVPTSKVNKKSPLRRYGALSGTYVRPDVWQSIRHYG